MTIAIRVKPLWLELEPPPLFLLTSKAGTMETAAVLRYEISNNWMFREASKDQLHPAEVLGCVHTDLLRNGLIPDPFFGTNEQELQWIGEKDWIYQTTFDLPADFLKQTNVELMFRGLDTYASDSNWHTLRCRQRRSGAWS